MYERYRCSTSLPVFVLFFFFFFCHSIDLYTRLMVIQTHFICISLVPNVVENVFRYLSPIYISSLLKSMLKSSANLQHWVVCFLVIAWRVLSIFQNQRLYQIHVLPIFSFILGLYFFFFFSIVSFFFFLKDFIYFLERGREGEREGENHQCVVASQVPPTGDLACNAGMCPDWELNQ